MAIHVRDISYGEIAEEAKRCLEDEHPDGSIPVPIEDIIDVGFKIDIVPTAYLETRFSSVAFITRDLHEIRVDEYVFRCQPSRLRFSLAHELAHVVLHKDIYGALVFSSPSEWKTAMGSIIPSDYKRMERQADIYAGLILVPPKQFQEQFWKIAEILEKGNTSFKKLSQESQDYAVSGLAKIFGVSSGTIWFRLRAEKFI